MADPIETKYKVIDNRKEEAPVPAKVETDNAFVTIFQIAAQKNYDPAFIEKMMDLQERQEGRIARQAYNEAMTAFKANPPDIEKDKKVSYTVTGKGTTAYNHASLANVTNKINRALSEHGLSASWVTNQSDGLKVTCTIAHKLGHSESTSLSAGPDTSGSKNAIQAIGSTVTYLERYTILALTGLATREQDDDGGGAGSGSSEYISEELLGELKAECLKRAVNEKKFLEHFEVDAIEHLPAKRFNEAMKLVKAKSIPKTTREPGCDDE